MELYFTIWHVLLTKKWWRQIWIYTAFLGFSAHKSEYTIGLYKKMVERFVLPHLTKLVLKMVVVKDVLLPVPQEKFPLFFSEVAPGHTTLERPRTKQY